MRTDGSFTFSSEEMELFAAASGDRSAIHTDPAVARRTAYGECIVYGGLETIALLGVLPAEVLRQVRTVRSSFPGAVIPGARCTARARPHPSRSGEWEVRLTGRGKVLARLTVSATEASGIGDRAALLERAGANGSIGAPAPTAIPSPGLEIAGIYRCGSELGILAERFCVQELNPGLLEGIAWASNVVGSSIPGFDGLCASVTLVADDGPSETAARHWIRVRDYDSRTDRVLIEGVLSDEGGRSRCVGLIECFPFGPTPVGDLTVPGLASGERAAAPRGQVVVSGGSRGAGAALALALLAGGYRVHCIYSRADQAADELHRRAGRLAGNLTLHRADAGNAEAMAALAASIEGPLEGLALCAAPVALAMGLVPDSAGQLVDYIADSTRLAATPLAAFTPGLARERAWVLFYSTADLAAPARDLPQFAAAKAALEGLARWVAVAHPRIRVVVARAPRMRTDLVNTPSARRAAAAPEEVASSILAEIDQAEPGFSIIEPDPTRARLLPR